MKRTPNTPARNDLDKLLEQWNSARWSIACREMQVRIAHGSYEAAHRVLAHFMAATQPGYATLESHVCMVFSARLASILESYGYVTVRSLDRVSDEQLLAHRNIGPANIDVVRQTIAAIKAGECIEIAPDELYEELIEAEHGYFVKHFGAPAATKRRAGGVNNRFKVKHASV